MFGSKKYQQFIGQVSFCRCGFSDWVGHPLGLGPEERKTVEELMEELKLLIDMHELQIVDNPKKAKVTCIVYAEYPDLEGYDILGCICFKGTKNPLEITYQGLGGDVNTLPLTKENSKVVYIK